MKGRELIARCNSVVSFRVGRLTRAAEFCQEQPLPRRQVVGRHAGVSVPDQVGDGHEDPVTGAVDGKAEGGVPSQVGIPDDDGLVKDGVGGVGLRDGDGPDAALEEGDEEAAVGCVPLGALAEEAGAVVVEDVGGGRGDLEGYYVGDGDGREYEEDGEGLRRAQRHCGDREREKER